MFLLSNIPIQSNFVTITTALNDDYKNQPKINLPLKTKEKRCLAINDKKQIGYFSQDVIDLLNLDVCAGTPIYIGQSNIEHIKNRHPYEFDRYFTNIEEIIAEPDYVGQNPKDQSITYVKLFQLESEYIRIAVRITPKKVAFAKSLHLLSTRNAERYIEHGTLKKLDK